MQSMKFNQSIHAILRHCCCCCYYYCRFRFRFRSDVTIYLTIWLDKKEKKMQFIVLKTKMTTKTTAKRSMLNAEESPKILCHAFAVYCSESDTFCTNTYLYILFFFFSNQQSASMSLKASLTLHKFASFCRLWWCDKQTHTKTKPLNFDVSTHNSTRISFVASKWNEF